MGEVIELASTRTEDRRFGLVSQVQSQFLTLWMFVSRLYGLVVSNMG